jgi:hypothetical protein
MEQNITDRKLGHEWYGWDGNVETHEGFIEEPKRLFFVIVAFTFGIVFAAACLLVWGFYPRLYSDVHPMAANASVALLVAFAVGFAIWFSAVPLAILTKKSNKLADAVAMQFIRMFDFFSSISKHCGITKDRLGYSLLEIHNEMIRMKIRKTSNGRLLVLSPRCLDRESADQIRSLSAEYDCDFYMAPTGAQARQKVVQAKPAAIIGIACERDLISGIRDVGYYFPVLGITNKRPIGPCKGAFIDMTELRSAIDVFRNRYNIGGNDSGNEASTQPSELKPAAS